MIKSLLYLHYLGEAVDVADILVMLVVGMWRGGRSRGAAMWRRSAAGLLRKATA